MASKRQRSPSYKASDNLPTKNHPVQIQSVVLAQSHNHPVIMRVTGGATSPGYSSSVKNDFVLPTSKMASDQSWKGTSRRDGLLQASARTPGAAEPMEGARLWSEPLERAGAGGESVEGGSAHPGIFPRGSLASRGRGFRGSP